MVCSVGKNVSVGGEIQMEFESQQAQHAPTIRMNPEMSAGPIGLAMAMVHRT